MLSIGLSIVVCFSSLLDSFFVAGLIASCCNSCGSCDRSCCGSFAKAKGVNGGGVVPPKAIALDNQDSRYKSGDPTAKIEAR